MKKYSKMLVLAVTVVLVFVMSTTLAFAESKVWNFDSGIEEWHDANDMTEPTFSNGKMIFDVTGGDPYLYSPGKLGLDCSKFKYVVVSVKNGTDNGDYVIYFQTDVSGIGETTTVHFTTDPKGSETKKYIVDMSQNSSWTGTLDFIRLDPGGNATGTVEIDYIAVTDNPDEVGAAPAAAQKTDTAAPADKASAAPADKTTAAPAASTEVPKTGDAGVVMYAIMALASGSVVLRKKIK